MGNTPLSEGFQKLPTELRGIVWEHAVDVEGLILWYCELPSERSNHRSHGCRFKRHQRENGVLRATRESRKYAKPSFDRRTRDKAVPNALLSGPGSSIKIGDDCIFFIPGAHIARYKSSQPSNPQALSKFVFNDAKFMDHLLVPLREVFATLCWLMNDLNDKKRVAEEFWGVFPDVHSCRYRYSILVDNYGEGEKKELEKGGWIDGMGIPLLTKVEAKGVSPQFGGYQKGILTYVENFFHSCEKENHDMIKDWGFVTWNKRRDGGRFEGPPLLEELAAVE